MIGTIDVQVNAAHPSMPLMEFAAFVNSPSQVRLRSVPRSVGVWQLTAVFANVTYPDNSTRSVELSHLGALWTGTIPGCAVDGRVVNGFQVIANGVDEAGNAITGYVLGIGDVCVLKRDGTVTVGKTSYYYHFLEEVPENPQVADVCVIDGQLKWYDGQSWIAFGGADMSHADFADLPVADLVPEEVGISEICTLLNAVKNLLRPAVAPAIALLLSAAGVCAHSATVETAKLVNLKGGSNVVTRVDLSGISSQLDAATQTNAQQSAAIAASATASTNYTDSATNELVRTLTGENPFDTIKVLRAEQADWANDADAAWMLRDFASEDHETRLANEIFEQMDASTGTNAQQTAQIAAMPSVVTNIVRDLSLGGIWDSQLEIWWTPRMRGGNLTYEATTNVNLNAEVQP